MKSKGDRDQLVWDVALAHCEHAIARISAAGRTHEYALGLHDAAEAIRDLPLATDLSEPGDLRVGAKDPERA